jgi:hypothetical protein
MKSPTAVGIIGLVVAGGAFYGGVQYQTSVQTAADAARVAARGDRAGQGFGARGAGGVGRFTPTSGTVLSKDATTMTIALTDGGSRIVILSTDTKTTHIEEAKLDSVKVGDSVTVMGSANPDGSVTADRIETGVFMRGGARAPRAPSTTQ